mgnify:FL=1
MTIVNNCTVVHTDHELREVLKSKNPVIALFYASWCPFCARFLPIFSKCTENEKRHFVMVRDDEETIADRYLVKAYPTVLFFENGVVSKRLDAELGIGLEEKELVEFMSKCPQAS